VDYKQAYYDLLSADKIGLRERIAHEVVRCGGGIFGVKKADEIFDWIMKGVKAQKAVNDLIDGVAKPSKQPSKHKRRGRPKKTNPYHFSVELSPSTKKKGKRKYTKRSKFWSKKK
jgi:hypothetical protein